jgi:hypothetical protein
MAPSANPDDRLFTPDRSLGSYGAKISLAARLGMIGPPIEQALHAIRSVRNDFAHNAGEPPLAAPSPLWIALAPLLKSQSGLTAQEQPSSCWSPPWWLPSKPAPSSRPPSRLGPPCASATGDRAMAGHPPKRIRQEFPR